MESIQLNPGYLTLDCAKCTRTSTFRGIDRKDCGPSGAACRLDDYAKQDDLSSVSSSAAAVSRRLA